MRAGFRYLVIGALLLAGGCQAPLEAAEPDEPDEPEAAMAPSGNIAHEDARFLVRGDDALYRVNVRYVDLIGESVIVVRHGPGDAGAAWPEIALSEAPRAPSGLPFDAAPWRDVAVEIAEAVRRREGLCPEGGAMQLSRGSDGEVRTMYRGNRKAWVVFAACSVPEQG